MGKEQLSSAVQEPSDVNHNINTEALANAEAMVKFLRKPNPRKRRPGIRQAEFQASFKPIDLLELPEALQYKGGYPIPPELFYGFQISSVDRAYHTKVTSEYAPYCTVTIKPVYGAEDYAIAAFCSNRSRWQNAPQDVIDRAAKAMNQKPMWYLSTEYSYWSYP